MARFSTDEYKVKKAVRFQFELLEPRHLFSVSPIDSPSSDTPPLELTSTSPPPEQQTDQALTNFTWLPMVFAGADKIVSVSSSLLLTGDVVVNATANLSIAWSKISGPGNALFGNSSSVSSSVQFDQAGTYELQLAATNAGFTSFDRIFVTVTSSNIINIDQAWLNAQGPGPYYLDQAGKTYVLQTDVTTKGTAFAIIASDVTLDLNGHKITYNDSAPITIPNGSFERGNGSTAADWNFVNAPNASRYQGVWLQNETYDGDYSLKFSDTKTSQYVRSTTTITLEPNTTYSLSAMFEMGGQGDYENPGVKGYVRLIGTNGEPIREVSWNQSNWRGIQLREGVFTTGSSAETYTIQVGVEGHISSTKPFYVDDIKIQRTNTYGVATQVQGWAAASYPGLNRNGAGTNATIKNGLILQGTDGGTSSHGVFIHEVSGVTVHNVNITVNGANSSAILGLNLATSDTTVTSNTLTSNVRTITSRDNFDGAVIKGIQGVIANNIIANGVHSGIAWTHNSEIYGNTIQLKSKYTNGFAIVSGPGCTIRDNVINCGTGDYAARGILATGSLSAPTKVFRNTVHVQILANNQEYEGEPLGGAYGIQLENALNIEVYENNVYAYGVATTAYAFRMNSDEGITAGVYVHDNQFKAISNGRSAGSTKFSGIDFVRDNVIFENNRLETNDSLVGASSDSSVLIKGSTIAINALVQNAHLIETDYSGTPGVHLDVTILNANFGDAASRTYLEGSEVHKAQRYGGLADAGGRFSLAWTTVISVQNQNATPISGANVEFRDRFNAIAAAGISAANGQYVANLKQFSIQGATKTTFSDYTATATKSGSAQQQSFTANKTQTFALQLGVLQQSINQSLDGELEGLALQALPTQPLVTFREGKGRDQHALKGVAERHAFAPIIAPKTSASSTFLTVQTPTVNSLQESVDNVSTEAIDEAHAGLADPMAPRVVIQQII